MNSDPAGRFERSHDPSANEIAAQMERILSSHEFAQSERSKRFLRYIVEETMAGRDTRLSEYAIGLDVFDRDESFDPRTSSIVRVEASRLRAKLERYKTAEGRHDAVHIALPPGRYVPAFLRACEDPEMIVNRADPARLGDARGVQSRRVAALVSISVLAVGTAAFFGPDLVSFRPSGDSEIEASRPARTYALAVLPLRNLSGEAADDYFSDGITDALITNLAKAGSVGVTSMTSVMAYKNVDRPVADIARELGVSHVIEGSVLRVGDRVRITAQLIEANSDRHVWAETYEHDVGDVLALQDEVVGHIVLSLSAQVGAASTPPRSSHAIDPAAYEAHLRGRFFLNRMTEEGFRKGIDYFRQAVEKAPEFAPAYSGMATCYCLLGGHGFELVRPSEGMPAAKEAVLEALRLDDSLAEAHAFLGIIRLKYEWDWAGAEQAFRRSIQLSPSYAQAHIFYSFFHEAMGRQTEAVREAEEARASDPLSLATNVNLGWQYVQAGRLEQARQIFESTAELDPGFWGIHWGLGHYYRRKGQYGEAIAAFQKAVAAGGGHAMPLSALGYTYAISDQPVEARKMLDQLTALADQSYVSPFNMALIHAGLSDKDEAFAWLEKAYSDRSRSMAWLNVADELDGLRSDPRFDSLLHRVGLPT